MQCPRCQHENPPGTKFCGECAAPLVATCPSCGTANPPENKFCGQCAAPLRTSRTAKFAGPDSYTPKHLAEKILTSKAALEGERKQVTVLFADLKGSMELLADRDPEEARKLLDPVLEHMMEAVHRYEGTVNQVMGDGIMALFGAPLAHEDHAVRACYAALRMQEAVRRHSDELRRAQGLEVQIRVGLNSGDVVVRSIGSDLRMDYTAVGQTTHLAARMEQLAAPGSIRLTGQTLYLAEGFVQVTALGRVPIKGLAEPVEVFELAGAGAARTRLEAAARRGLTRFVGRNAELEQLRDAVDQAGLGNGQVVAVVGEPGVGKSRLFWELIHSHRVHGWLTLQAASVSYATAYLPVIELLRGYFEIESRDDPRKIREKITGRVLTLAPELGSVLPALLALLDVGADEASWQALDPRQRRQQTLGAVKRLLVRESELQPLVLVFEDLHWIDGETQSLLDNLIDSLPAARLLLLVNYRPEYQHAWGGKTYYRQFRIDPLPPERADELLDALLGPHPALGPLKQLLIGRTEANPLFLEESVRGLVERGVLAGERGTYRLTRPVEQLDIPVTVQAILAARLDRLAPEAKRLLQAAAVIGKDVPMPQLLAIADAPEDEVRAELANLQAAEFLYETRIFPDLEYTFKHALTHEVAYSSLLHEQRRTLHARVADAIERLYRDRLNEHIDRLAHHAFRGEQWAKAVTFAQQAGARARGHSAYRQVVVSLEQALEALSHLPQSRETVAQAIDLRIELRLALLAVGEWTRMSQELEAALSLAESTRDEPRLARIFAYQSHYFWLTGHQRDAVLAGDRAQRLARQVGDTTTDLQARFHVGQAHHALGEFRQAVDILRSILEPLRGGSIKQDVSWTLSIHARTWLAWCLAEQGEFAEAAAHGEEALRAAEALGDTWCLSHAYLGLGVPHLLRGNLADAIQLFERNLARCAPEALALVPTSTSWLGSAYALSGRFAEGLAQLEDAIAKAESMGHLRITRTMMRLGQGQLLAGRADVALQTAQRARARSRNETSRGDEAWIVWLLAEIHAAGKSSDVARSEVSYREALGLAAALAMRPLVAHCHLGLGKLYRRLGKQQEAQEHLTTATTMYREMDMRYWLEQAEADRDT